MTLARRLAAFAAALRFEDIPADVVASIRLRALDVLGIALAASSADFAPAVMAVAEGWEADSGCTIVGSRRRAPAPLAILANGALAHGLDFDDTHAPSITHPSAVVLPCALAVGEAAGADGRTVIAAAAAGYEAIARLGMAASGAFHARGWHATAVCGPFAAALAAGRVHGLDAARLTAGLGIAGSFASGVLEFLEDGSWVKRLHPGWAGHSGAVAAALARAGFTGPATALEGRFGFYRTFLGVAPDAGAFDTLGRRWETLRVSFKPYPCCHYNHAYLDCALELRRRHALTPEQVEQVECCVPAGEVPIVCEPREAKIRPRTAYDARFSLPYSVAAALVDGGISLDTYAPARLADAAILDLAARVSHAVDPGSTFPQAFPGWVRIRLRDGRVVEARAPDGRGGPEHPLHPDEVAAKFRDNASRALPAGRVHALERAALALDTLDDVRRLTELCRP